MRNGSGVCPGVCWAEVGERGIWEVGSLYAGAVWPSMDCMSAAAKFTGTAFPICLVTSATVPVNSYWVSSSRNPMARASSEFCNIRNLMSSRYGWPSMMTSLRGSISASLSCWRWFPVVPAPSNHIVCLAGAQPDLFQTPLSGRGCAMHRSSVEPSGPSAIYCAEPGLSLDAVMSSSHVFGLVSVIRKASMAKSSRTMVRIARISFSFLGFWSSAISWMRPDSRSCWYSAQGRDRMGQELGVCSASSVMNRARFR